MTRTSQRVALYIMVPYALISLILCFLVMDRLHCDSPYYYTKYDEPESSDAPESSEKMRLLSLRYCAGGLHSLLCLFATILIGCTILIYRLMIGVRTRKVKYIHLGLHTVSLITLSIGLWCVVAGDYTIVDLTFNLHMFNSWVIYYVFIVQFLVATIIYAYQYPNFRLRILVAPFHDIAGIWLFICFVACSLSGRDLAQVDYGPRNREWFASLSYINFTCVLIIILSPFYEWDVVGPL